MAENPSTGRDLDRIVKTDEGPRIAGRPVIFDDDLVPNAIISPP